MLAHLWIILNLSFNLSHASPLLSPDEQRKLNAIKEEVFEIAKDEFIIQAVQKWNHKMPPQVQDLTNAKWRALSVRSEIVKSLLNNEASRKLKNYQKPYMTEMFLSGKEGTKVAFLEKPSSWSHKGKEKHELPMSGKIWQGPLEFDESAGINQVQIAVPVYDEKVPIGSLVIGVSIARL